MNKTLRFLSLILSILLLTTAVFAVEAGQVTVTEIADFPDLKLPCKSAILIEQTTGTVLYEQNPDEKLPIASVSKIMTLLLTMEALEKGVISFDENVPISENAASRGGSQAYLEAGEIISLNDVLKAVFVSSANDGAVALAEWISGSVDGFVAAMNEKAADLGMHDTIFYNPTGLDDGETNLSTAHDVALMSKALLKYEKIYDYTGIWIDSIRNGAFGLDLAHVLDAGAFIVADDLRSLQEDGVVADALIVEIFRHFRPDLIMALPVLPLHAGNQAALPQNPFHISGRFRRECSAGPRSWRWCLPDGPDPERNGGWGRP